MRTRKKRRDWNPDKAENPSEYDLWVTMRQRCNNPRNPEYHNYGGRGIFVCARWLASFRAFLDDMGKRPEGLTLDRIDNNGPYAPENCRWASLKQQMRNKRDTRLLTHNGKTMCLTDWATHLGIHHQTLRNRLRRGWPLEEALSTARVSLTNDPTTGVWVRS